MVINESSNDWTDCNSSVGTRDVDWFILPLIDGCPNTKFDLLAGEKVDIFKDPIDKMKNSQFCPGATMS